MREVCSRYGIELNRSGFARCPFHSGDRTPSLKIYEGNRGYHCFGCGKHGGVIDFTMQYFRLDFKQAVSKLNYDFALNLPIGNRPTLRDMREDAEKEKARKAALLSEQHAHENAVNAYCSALNDWIALDIQKRKYAPNSDYIQGQKAAAQLYHRKRLTQIKPYHQKYVEALLKIDNAAYVLDLAEGRLRELERQRFYNHSGLDG